MIARGEIDAELDNKIVGMSLSFPAEFHCINDEMRKFFPSERLEHFKVFFSARVDNSYMIDAICVDKEYRNKGTGEKLLQKTIEKAHNEGFSLLSLLVFADNHKAINYHPLKGWLENMCLEGTLLLVHA